MNKPRGDAIEEFIAQAGVPPGGQRRMLHRRKTLPTQKIAHGREISAPAPRMEAEPQAVPPVRPARDASARRQHLRVQCPAARLFLRTC
jgi:hypothetical protein